MTRWQHYANSILWWLNAFTWTFWAGSVGMGLMSACAAIAAVILARNTDTWRHR